MTVKIKKLDGRYTGSDFFQYCIQSNSLYNKEYYDIREWCWETWGPSKELNYWLLDNKITLGLDEKVGSQNQHWCWQNDTYSRRLYFRTDKELVLLKLRWE